MATNRDRKKRSVKEYIRILIHQRETPNAVAFGLCLGLVIGLQPVYGIQLPIAVLLALLFRCNKLAAAAGVFITNPFTAIPIYSLTFYLGAVILRRPLQPRVVQTFVRYCLQHVRLDNLDEAEDIAREASRLGADVALPLVLGGLVLAGVLCVFVYPAMRMVVRRFRLKRSRRLAGKRMGMGKESSNA